jgi:hypothetical protein
MDEPSIERRDSAFLDGSIRDMFGESVKDLSAIAGEDRSWEENKLDQGLVEEDESEDPGGDLEEMLREVMDHETDPAQTHRGSTRPGDREKRSSSRQSQHRAEKIDPPPPMVNAIRAPSLAIEDGNEGRGCQSCSGREVSSAIQAFCLLF